LGVSFTEELIFVVAGNPWEQRRSVKFPVNFGGSVEDGKWTPAFAVTAQAYDCPIPGWKTENCGNLRLWDALPAQELDLNAFNKGKYIEASEAKRKADAIVSVLYPNDSTPEGKQLRLQQQFFFVSASMQVCRLELMQLNLCINLSAVCACRGLRTSSLNISRVLLFVKF
jgi:starch phosphorylase